MNHEEIFVNPWLNNDDQRPYSVFIFLKNQIRKNKYFLEPYKFVSQSK